MSSTRGAQPFAYDSWMMTPGTYGWHDALGAMLTAAVLLFVPGLLVGLLARFRLSSSLALSPAVSTVVLVSGGSVAAAVGVRWSVISVAVTLVIACLGASVIGILRAARSARRASVRSLHTRTRRSSPPWIPALSLACGVGIALALVALVLLRSADTPEEFPQHPDTIFHLGVTQWMVENGDASFQHGTRFTGAPTNAAYPVGFHVLAATTSLLSGVPAVVAISALVLVVAGAAWPLTMGLLGRSMFGSSPIVPAVAAISSTLFVAYPTMLMGFGVLWPNMFGQALIPGLLMVIVNLTRSFGEGERTRRSANESIGLLAVGFAGSVLAHQNAFISAVVFGAFIVWSSCILRSWRRRGASRSWVPGVLATGALLLGLGLSPLLRRPSMLLAGQVGPEMTTRDSILDIVSFAPRIAEGAPFLAVLVALGIVATLIRFPRALWLTPAMAFFTALYFISTAIDTPTLRLWTWPWYNNAIRIASVGVLPAALLATAALLFVPLLIGKQTKHPWVWETVVAGLLLGLLLVGTHGYIHRDVKFLRPYFHPGVARSWANPQELKSLRELAAYIPKEGLIAADPFRGETYIYVVGDRRSLFPTEKANNTEDKKIIGLYLADVDTDPAACAAVKRTGVTHAIIGGVPFLWGQGESRRKYSGIERIQPSASWKLVAERNPYRLFEFTGCHS